MSSSGIRSVSPISSRSSGSGSAGGDGSGTQSQSLSEPTKKRKKSKYRLSARRTGSGGSSERSQSTAAHSRRIRSMSPRHPLSLSLSLSGTDLDGSGKGTRSAGSSARAQSDESGAGGFVDGTPSASTGTGSTDGGRGAGMSGPDVVERPQSPSLRHGSGKGGGLSTSARRRLRAGSMPSTVAKSHADKLRKTSSKGKFLSAPRTRVQKAILTDDLDWNQTLAVIGEDVKKRESSEEAKYWSNMLARVESDSTKRSVVSDWEKSMMNVEKASEQSSSVMAWEQSMAAAESRATKNSSLALNLERQHEWNRASQENVAYNNSLDPHTQKSQTAREWTKYTLANGAYELSSPMSVRAETHARQSDWNQLLNRSEVAATKMTTVSQKVDDSELFEDDETETSLSSFLHEKELLEQKKRKVDDWNSLMSGVEKSLSISTSPVPINASGGSGAGAGDKRFKSAGDSSSQTRALSRGRSRRKGGKSLPNSPAISPTHLSRKHYHETTKAYMSRSSDSDLGDAQEGSKRGGGRRRGGGGGGRVKGSASEVSSDEIDELDQQVDIYEAPKIISEDGDDDRSAPSTASTSLPTDSPTLLRWNQRERAPRDKLEDHLAVGALSRLSGDYRTQVFVNVYDLIIDKSPLTKFNNKTINLGFGIFHTGVEINGREYTFGYDLGVFQVKPKNVEGAVFRESILIGTCPLSSRRQLHELVMKMSLKNYKPEDYHFLKHNCNSFVQELCQVLTGNSPPAWINRMARACRFFDFFFDSEKLTPTVSEVPAGEEGKKSQKELDRIAHSQDRNNEIEKAGRENPDASPLDEFGARESSAKYKRRKTRTKKE